MNPSHRALRDATAGAHDRVDAAFGGFDLTEPLGYAAFLGAHADAVLPLEAALDAAGAAHVVTDWQERKRSALLRADLDALSVSPAPSFPAHAGDVGAIAGPAGIVGTIYVLEGSRLGGKFLARSVPADFPRRYLIADQPAGAWRALLERIDLLLDGPDARQAAIDAALAAFGRFERSGNHWLVKVDA